MLRQERYVEAEHESRLGYEILSRQSEPSVSWQRSAREDLTTIDRELGREEDAAALRAESDRVD